jgi:hypothetical protein
MERKDTRRSAGAQVLENGALDGVFTPTAVAGVAVGRGLTACRCAIAGAKV